MPDSFQRSGFSLGHVLHVLQPSLQDTGQSQRQPCGDRRWTKTVSKTERDRLVQVKMFLSSAPRQGDRLHRLHECLVQVQSSTLCCCFWEL